jgi:hypothetical protein
LEQGRFGTHQNLQALIENWSLRIGHWQLSSASPTAQWPSRWRFQSAGSIMFELAGHFCRPGERACTALLSRCF